MNIDRILLLKVHPGVDCTQRVYMPLCLGTDVHDFPPATSLK